MSKTYTRLTKDERYQFYEGVTEKRSHREIAIRINNHHCTVSDEVMCNAGLRGDRPKQAQDKALGGDIHKHPRHRKPYKKRTGSAETGGQIIGRISIEERPSIVDKKVRIGDWEAYTIIGKG
jgi:IS30 family transposase